MLIAPNIDSPCSGTSSSSWALLVAVAVAAVRSRSGSGRGRGWVGASVEVGEIRVNSSSQADVTACSNPTENTQMPCTKRVAEFSMALAIGFRIGSCSSKPDDSSSPPATRSYYKPL